MFVAIGAAQGSPLPEGTVPSINRFNMCRKVKCVFTSTILKLLIALRERVKEGVTLKLNVYLVQAHYHHCKSSFVLWIFLIQPNKDVFHIIMRPDIVNGQPTLIKAQIISGERYYDLQ